MEGFVHDLRYGLRMLRNTPGFTAVAIVTLALGIGANTAIFSFVNSLFLHPSGVVDPGRLLAVRVGYDKINLPNIDISLPDFLDVRESKQIFSSAAVATPADYNYAAQDGPKRLIGAQVSSEWFQTFGVRPFLGRDFRAEEDQPKANRVAIVSYVTWTKLFGGDRDIIGKTIQLNSQAYQIVGVASREFSWPSATELWVPLGLPASAYAPDNRFNESYYAVARVKPGITPEQADAFIRLKSRHLPQPQAQAYAQDSGWKMFAMPFVEVVYGNLRTPMLLLLGAVGFVLLIACANIAGLMLARASGRARELAIRVALGARPWRLIRQTLTESLLLALAGGLLGLADTRSAIRILKLLAPDETLRNLSVSIDPSVLVFTLGMVLLSGLLFGIAAAWQMSRADEVENLKRSGTAGRRRLRLRSALVAAEVSMALVLLLGSALLLKSLIRLETVNPGFEARGVMTASLSLSPTAYDNESKRAEFYRAVTEHLASQPSVLSAAAAVPLPFGGGSWAGSFQIEGHPLGPGDPGPQSDEAFVTPQYFSALRIPLRSGRVFSEQDRADTQLVVVIDDTLARQYWPNQDPIGQRVREGPKAPWATVIGVVGHVHRSALAGDSGKGVRYYSLLEQPSTNALLIARTAADPRTLTLTIREAVHSIDAVQAAVYEFRSMAELVAASLGPRSFVVALLGTFAILALLLAALGLYGIISYSVAQRTQEIGIRMALGADSKQVLGMVIGQGLSLVGIGALIATVAAFALSRVVNSQLYAIGVFDPATLLLMMALMGTVALIATYIPARRATQVDPVVALRDQ